MAVGLPTRGYAGGGASLATHGYASSLLSSEDDIVLPSPQSAESIADAEGDLALLWSNEVGSADLYRIASALVPDAAVDLASDRGLVTAVLLSLFLDRRANDDDVPPSGDPTDRRGCWADEFNEVEGDLMGSRLWLLDRSKATNENALRLREYVLEALAWMLEDRVVSAINVPVELDGDRILWAVELQRPGKDPVTFRFSHVWDHLRLDVGS